MRGIEFNALFPPVWIVSVATLSLIIFVWLEIARRQKLLPLRLIAVVIAILSLACLALNPHRNIEKSSDVVLLTAGFDNQILDSLVRTNGNLHVYKLGDVVSRPTVEEINYRDLDNVHGNIHILGQGVPEYMLDYFDGKGLKVYPAKQTSGVIALDLVKAYTANRINTVQGTYHSPGNRTVRLQANGITIDSVRFTKGTHPLRLSFTPKAPGQYVYTLTESDSSGKMLTSESLPVDVKPQKQLSILFLSDFPTAEIRFLKNYLETQQHKLTLRYKISKDRYRTEFVNTKEGPVTRISESTLKSFDLVITDASTLNALSGQERNSLEQAVNAGLGMLTTLDSSEPSLAVRRFLQLNASSIKSDSATLIINRERVKFPATAVAVSSDQRLTSLVSDVNDRVISGYVQRGFGKNGFLLLTNTFTLQLSGQTENYATLWSDLISAVARKERNAYDLSFTTAFPVYPDEPVEFQITSADTKPTVLTDSAEVPVYEHPLIENVWYGKVWAGRTGWHTLTIRQSPEVYNFFVSRTGNLPSVRVANQQNALKKMISPGLHLKPQHVAEPLSRVIFFVLFVLAAGFLWLTPKL